MTINLKSCRIVSSMEKIEAIMKKFGHRIQKFKIWCSIQSESAELSESQLTKILKCIPEVRDLTLRNIYVREGELSIQELDLHKLKRLSIDYCLFEAPSFFNRIPIDVLQDLVYTFESPDETHYQSFFNRQTKIRKLEMFENDQIKFDHLELEHLKISSSANFVQMISEQPKLRYLDFAITWIDDDVFDAVCKLKHLEVLKTLIDQVTCNVFKDLAELTNLKELRMDSHSSFDCGHLLVLSMMKCTRLEKLTLLCTDRKIPEDIVIQMSSNFRNLKHVEFINRSIKIISVILECFPNLESLLLDFFAIFGAPEDVLAISDDLKHDKLKQLVITNVNTNEAENTQSLLKLVQACPNLQRIMLSQLTDFTNEDFKGVLESHRHLTHLSLEFDGLNFDYDVISVIENSGKNLVHLRLNGLSRFPSYATMRTLFDETFPNITLYKYSTGTGELVMKKRNVADWYLNFKLMDHF